MPYSSLRGAILKPGENDSHRRTAPASTSREPILRNRPRCSRTLPRSSGESPRRPSSPPRNTASESSTGASSPRPRWTKRGCFSKRPGRWRRRWVPAGRRRGVGARLHAPARRSPRAGRLAERPEQGAGERARITLRRGARSGAARHAVARARRRGLPGQLRQLSWHERCAVTARRPPGLEPAPSPLRDWKLLADQSPLDYYRRVSIGVVGTAMPAFEGRLSAEDRWAVALYAIGAAPPCADGRRPRPALDSFPTTGRMSDVELLGRARRAGRRRRRAGWRESPRYGHSRSRPPRRPRPRSSRGSAPRSIRPRRWPPRAIPERQTAALDAYMTFEQVERSVRAKDPALAAELEAEFAALRAARGGADATELARRPAPPGRRPRARRARAGRPARPAQPLPAVVRHPAAGGSRGDPHRRRPDHLPGQDGCRRTAAATSTSGSARPSSPACSPPWRSRRCSSCLPAHQEALEGAHHGARHRGALLRELLAAVQDGSGQVEPLREEQGASTRSPAARRSRSPRRRSSPCTARASRRCCSTRRSSSPATGRRRWCRSLAGMAVGAVVLAAVYVAIHRFGVRLPLKPFFGVTSAFLYYMAFVFAGQGIAELQEGGLVSTTPVGVGAADPRARHLSHGRVARRPGGAAGAAGRRRWSGPS